MSSRVRVCGHCDREFTPTSPRQRKCPLCIAADPHRNGSRQLPEMVVVVDGEGTARLRTKEEIKADPEGGMWMRSFSFGREDGTTGSITASDDGRLNGLGIIEWLFASGLNETYEAANGTVYKQVVQIFHGQWDMSVIAKDFITDLTMVHKAGAREVNQLCSSNHEHDLEFMVCVKEHRDDEEMQQHVLGEGGEGPLLTLHRPSGYGMSATPHRRIWLEHRPHGDRYDNRRQIDIHDIGRSFTGGLEKVIDSWNPELTPEQREVIAWGKKARKTQFEGATPAQLTAYSEAECVATARISRMLVEALKRVHIPIKMAKLYGSGSVATQALKHYGVPKAEELAVCTRSMPGGSTGSMTIDDIGRYTYFGGKIEAPVVGRVCGEVDTVDIRSAYPAAATHIPDMRPGSGEWHVHRGDLAADAVSPDTLGYVLASWDVSSMPSSTMPFQVRSKSLSVFGVKAMHKLWVTLPEYIAAKEHYGDLVFAHSATWWVENESAERPFEWLEELYNARLQMKVEMALLEEQGQEGSNRWMQLNCEQQAVKLVINSVYGKLAQRDPKPSPWTYFHHASFITGMTRATVNRESWLREAQGGRVLYQHTDSVRSMGGNPVDGGERLGTWEYEKTANDVFIAQPGLLLALGGGKSATRGVQLQQFDNAVRGYTDEQGVYHPGFVETQDLTAHPTTWKPLEVKRIMMFSRRLARHLGRPEIAGAFLPYDQAIQFNTGKRDVTSAVPLPGEAGAWVVPPRYTIPRDDIAQLEDLLTGAERLLQARRAGLLDRVYGDVDPDSVEAAMEMPA